MEHIEITDTAERGSEPFELPAKAVDPVRVEKRSTRTEDGPEPANRHAHLVDVLRIASIAGAGLVGVNGIHLRFDCRENVIEGGTRRHSCCAFDSAQFRSGKTPYAPPQAPTTQVRG